MSRSRIGLIVVCLLCCGYSPGAEPEERPRIGLALSGGGARGYAHIGILKVFENHSSLGNAIKVAHWLKQVGIEHRVLDAGGAGLSERV